MFCHLRATIVCFVVIATLKEVTMDNFFTVEEWEQEAG